MARTKRKEEPSPSVAAAKSPETEVYNTGIYTRLSVEDNGREGSSIEIQKAMLIKYVEQRPWLKLCSQYSDNGMTGTSFERPGFCAMLEDVKKGRINCIVVKDLSRFGRNYIETGDFLETVFPCLDVRFISVNDGYDSGRCRDSGCALTIALKNLSHDLYARDISKKIRTSFAVRKKRGEFLGSMAPYGYQKSERDGHVLVIDGETAENVRRIYRWRLEGLGAAAIARRLNDMGEPSPKEYLRRRGLLKKDASGTASLWYGSTVSGILKNPVYTGCMVERKEESAPYRGAARRKIPRSQWKLIEGTQEAIISLGNFERVQSLLENAGVGSAATKEEGSGSGKQENSLRGLVVCGSCGRKLERDSSGTRENGTAERAFRCRQKYIRTGACIGMSIKESRLKTLCGETLQSLLRLAAVANHSENRLPVKQTARNGRGVDKKQYELFHAYTRRRISEEEYRYFKSRYEEERQAIQSGLKETRLTALEDQQKLLRDIAERGPNRGEAIWFFREIRVYEGGRMEIRLRFQDPFFKKDSENKQEAKRGGRNESSRPVFENFNGRQETSDGTS